MRSRNKEQSSTVIFNFILKRRVFQVSKIKKQKIISILLKEKGRWVLAETPVPLKSPTRKVMILFSFGIL